MKQNGKPTTWTNEQVETAIKMRTAGASVSEIAEAVGKTEGAVSGKLWQLRKQGKLNNEEPQNSPEEFEVCEEPTEETAELSPLEKEMAAIIEEQKAQIDHLNEMLVDVERARSELFDEKTKLEQEYQELLSRAQELRRELDDTKLDLEETEQEFDKYRAEVEKEADTVEKYEKDLMAKSVEVGALREELARIQKIALGVVEKFALSEAEVRHA